MMGTFHLIVKVYKGLTAAQLSMIMNLQALNINKANEEACVEIVTKSEVVMKFF